MNVTSITGIENARGSLHEVIWARNSVAGLGHDALVCPGRLRQYVVPCGRVRKIIRGAQTVLYDRPIQPTCCMPGTFLRGGCVTARSHSKVVADSSRFRPG